MMKEHKLIEDAIVTAGNLFKEKQYWINKLQGGNLRTVYPFDYTTSSFEAKQKSFKFSSEIANKLITISKNSDPQLHMLLVSGLLILLWKYTGNDDIIIGTSIDKQETERKLINTILPIRVNLKKENSFKDILYMVRDTINEGIENQNFPIEQINFTEDEKGVGFELFDIAVVLENIQCREYLSHIRLNLQLFFKKRNDEIDLIIEYNSKLYRDNTIERLFSTLQYLFEKCFEGLDINISSIDLIQESEKKKLLFEFNNTEFSFPTEDSVVQLFEKQVGKDPSAIAIQFNNMRISYSELNSKSNQIATYLKSNQIEKDRTVGVLLDRSPLMIASILAIWKTGLAYIPLDKTYPVRRIKEILESSNTDILISSHEFDYLELDNILNARILRMDNGFNLGDEFSVNIYCEYSQEDLAYVIFTSGSTGNPKGVMVEQVGMLNHLYAKIIDLNIDKHSVIAQNSSHTFDISVWQFFAALTQGGKVVIYPNDLLLNINTFIDHIYDHKVTHFEVVPSYLSVIMEYLNKSDSRLSNLKYLIVTGEELKIELVKEWFARYKNIKMVNAYGPTEASDDITHHIMDKLPEGDKVPIGKTIQNMSIYIVDENMNLCPIGVKGELCVAGIGVGKGYVNDEEKTKSLFMINPFRSDRKERLYKTGDIGKWNEDGTLDFFGRNDQQVKIRGYRIELGEIENKLLEINNIKEVVVLSKLDNTGTAFLCAYYTIKNSVDIAELKNTLLKSLPNYMIPSYFIEVGEMPLSSNGKINRNALPEPNYDYDTFLPYFSKKQLEEAKSDEIFNLNQEDKKNYISNLITNRQKEHLLIKNYSDQVGKEFYNLSHSQKMIYYTEKKSSESCCENLIYIIKYNEILNKEILEEAINIVIQKHDTLRLRIAEIESGEVLIPVQYLVKEENVSIDSFDCSCHDENYYSQWLEQNNKKPIPKGHNKLWYFSYIKFNEKESGYYMKIHHIISDGWTTFLLTGEIDKIYRLLLENGKANFNIGNTYLQYLAKENQYIESNLMQQDIEFWHNYLSPLPEKISLSKEKEEIVDFKGDSLVLTISNQLRGKIHDFIKEQNISIYKLVLSALSIYISRVTLVRDFVIGSLNHNRSDEDDLTTSGAFIRFLPIRIRLEENVKISTFVQQISDELSQLLKKHSRYPFDSLINELREKTGIDTSYFFNVNLIGHPDVSCQKYELQHVFPGDEPTPISIHINFNNQDLKGILEIEYDFNLFKFSRSDIYEIHSAISRILNYMVENPEDQISSIDYITFESRNDVLEGKLHYDKTKYPDLNIFSDQNNFILNGNDKIMPSGSYGELCVEGDDYITGAEMNYDLRPNPFTRKKWIVRTGFIGKWKNDGVIDLVGKKNSVMPLNGNLIDYSALNDAIRNFPSIKDFVIVKHKKNNLLVVYFSSNKKVNVREITCLNDSIPPNLYPYQWIQLESIPTDTEGKADMKLLSSIQIDLNIRLNILQPTNETEKKLNTIWSEILGLNESKIGIDMNFFELGGTSLNATILVSKIHKQLDVKIGLSEVFRFQTIKSLAMQISLYRKERFESIKLVEKRKYYRLSSAQKRMYFLYEFDKTSLAYNMPQVVILEGELDKGRLSNAFEKLIARHESLRTSFEIINEVSVQMISDRVNFEIEYFQSCKEESQTIIKEFIRPFDLSKIPLLRVGLVKTAPLEHILMVDMHHIITDGISQGVLIKEFIALYNNEKLPGLRLQYKDYSEWQQGEEQQTKLVKQKEFWLNEFAEEASVFNLPTDFIRATVKNYEGSSIGFELGKEDTDKLKFIAEKEDVTMFMVILSVFNILLSKIGSQEDIVIGIPVAGRQHAELEHMIGMFVNTLALRNFVNGELSYKEFLPGLKAKTLACFDNQAYQYEELIDDLKTERDTSRNPMFDIMFSYQNFETNELIIPGLCLKPYKGGSGHTVSKFDITMSAVESSGQVFLNFEYSTPLFKRETIERFISYFNKIVSTIIFDPSTKISDIEIISADEKHMLLYKFNDTKSDCQEKRAVHELFQEQVKKCPDTIALDFQWHQFSYKELNNKSNQLARFLQSRGVTTGSKVGLMLNRSIDAIIGILGTLKSGGVYVPIEKNYPDSRKQFLVKDSEMLLLLSDIDLINENIDIFKEITFDNFISIDDSEIYCGDQDDMARSCDSNTPAYIIYTSGSTGNPKGVIVEHSGLTNYTRWGINYYIGAEKVSMPLYTSLSFDLTITSIYLPLLSGNRILISKEGDIIGIIEEILKKDEANLIKCTPSHLRIFEEFLNEKRKTRIRKFIVGGELLDAGICRQIAEKFPEVKIYNEYGPTEATVGCMIYQYNSGKDKGKSVPIGIPINNTQVYVLDNNGKQLKPIGVAGELCVSGYGLSQGYLKRDELTKEKFITHPFIERERLYRTGDLARWLPDGNMEFLGRIDHQVKIRGFRVELGEVEAQLLSYEKIKEAVVVVKEKGEDKYLVAYYTSAEEVDDIEFRNHLSNNLPDYMLPAYYVHLSSLPLSSNGKLNMKDLPDPEIKAGEDYMAPSNDTEGKLVEIWSKVLKIEKNKISIYSNFFELGGHSINLLKVNRMINNEFKLNISVPNMFRLPNIYALADFIIYGDEKVKELEDGLEERMEALKLFES